jgi:lipoprotein-anchoring transpeptidase ErfK/SrfK
MVAAADIDRDGQAEVLTVPRRAGGPNVRAFSSGGTALSTNFMAYESDFSGGVALSATTALDKDKALEIITVPQKNTLQGDAKKYKYIDVNLSDQTLRAYKAGRVDLEFLISSGVAAHPSPIGDFAILQKIPVMDYTWNYGPGNPDNYDLKNVPWNLHFYADYFVHNAYWHNNFGNPMSHGCINASLENSKAIYDWANVGDPISVHY